LQNLKVFVLPEPASPTSITAVSPSTVFVASDNLVQFPGAVPSNQTFVAFVYEGKTNKQISK